MCKLFFTLYDEKISDHVKEFLAQSNECPNKKCNKSKDGFGLVWMNPDIREKSYGDRSLENTHPFLHDNHVFMHNGGIVDFEKHAKFIKSYIARKFHPMILGETDSEVLFYLLLSFMEYCKNKSAYAEQKKSPAILSKKQILLYEKIDTPNSNCAISMMFRFFEMNSIALNANIIYSTPSETIIIKYASPGIEYKPLYLNRCKSKGILITTKVLNNYTSTVIPENTVLSIDYTKGTIRVNKIL
jgi:predicted glutamine amidotransferase